MVDGVELAVIDEVLHVGNLDHGHAPRLEQLRDALHHPVEVGHVGEDVVGVDHVGALAERGQVAGDLGAEELTESGDAPLVAGHPGDVRGRLDAEHRDALVMVVLEQVAVVARDLDHQAVGAEGLAGHHPAGDALRILDDGVGEGREVEVLAEEHLGRHGLGDLHQRAVGAEHQIERERSLRLVELLGGQEGVGERRPAEGQHRPEVRRLAGPADGALRHCSSRASAGFHPGARSRADA